jgi:endonuclease-8
MPEGDTLARIAAVLGPALSGRRVTAARGRPGGAQLERLVGSTVDRVEARGKHLLIDFNTGLTLHTHLGLHGSWHRYRPAERWRRAPARAVAVLETDAAVAVCYDAPTVELMDTRAVAIHPGLRVLGSDTATEEFNVEDSLTRLRHPSRAQMSVGDALLDQSAVAGFGNVYRSELCFLERVDPFAPVSAVSDTKLRAMLERGAQLVKVNSAGGERVTTPAGVPGNVYVYGRTGRPCLRCRTRIQSRVVRAREQANPRRVYWCPSCQPRPEASSPSLPNSTLAR